MQTTCYLLILKITLHLSSFGSQNKLSSSRIVSDLSKHFFPMEPSHLLYNVKASKHGLLLGTMPSFINLWDDCLVVDNAIGSYHHGEGKNLHASPVIDSKVDNFDDCLSIALSKAMQSSWGGETLQM